ncbi:MAG: hypothetical protein ACRD3G_11460 [Vicinamibacterales bacterium]
MTSAKEQELLELEQRVDGVSRELLQYVLRRALPPPEQLQRWVHALSKSGVSFNGGDVGSDERPLMIEGRITITRAAVETSCCLHHAVNKLVTGTWDGLFESMDKALWRLPKTRYPHERSTKH